MKKRGLFTRGQISVEYLIVIGFVVFAIISILGIAFYYASDINDQLKSNQLENFATKIISSSESVFFAGEPSKVTVTAFLPDGIHNIDIIDDAGEMFLVFNVSTNSGFNIVGFRSDVPIGPAGMVNISTERGAKRLEIVAGETEVSISESL